jgi:hypothetical protein
MQDNATIEKLKGDLLHYSYYSIRQHLDQINKFSEIAANEGIMKGKKSSLFIAVFKSIWKFKRDYIFKLGFLDGYYGFVVCALSAHMVFIKYLKMNELKKAGK